MKKTAIALLFVLTLCTLAAAQQDKSKRPSPPAQTECKFSDGKTITVDYSSPRMKGRKIFGGLVPYGEVWRAGANSATSLSTTGDLQIENLKVPAGNYTLYALPQAGAWTLIVNKQTGQWGTEYSESQDLGRVKMAVSKAPSTVETFKITLSNEGGNRGKLTMEWENTVASAPFTVQ